jgi:integrase
MADQLTDQMIKKMPVPEKGSKRYPDSQAKGFGVRITSTGAVAFFVRYWTKAGQRKLYTIGAFPAWTTKAARAEALRLMRDVDQGGDPLGEYQEVRAAPTVGDLLDRYAREYLSETSTRLRPASKKQYLNLVANHIRPNLGKLKVADVEYSHVDAMHQKITNTAPTTANRALAVASKIFSLGIQWKMIDRNPCQGVQRNQETKRKRYLVKDELARLNEVLATDPDGQGANILRLMLLTGCRKGEAMAARWADFDLDSGIWTKPGSTTKQKTEHRAPISAPAIALLRSLDAAGEFVFPAHTKEGHRVAMNKTWERIRDAASFPDVNMHDLRHTYASVLVSAGLSLPVVGALLGHSQPTTTARYAHLQDDPLRAATEQAGAILGGDNVVRLRK